MQISNFGWKCLFFAAQMFYFLQVFKGDVLISSLFLRECKECVHTENKQCLAQCQCCVGPTHTFRLYHFYRTHLWGSIYGSGCLFVVCPRLTLMRLTWCDSGWWRYQLNTMLIWQCKWRHLVAKFLSNASGTIWWPNFLIMPIQLLEYQMGWAGGWIYKLTPAASL